MATPVIDSISPATGPASGYNEVEISGYYFNTPGSFTPTVPGTVRVPTVAVTFNGVAAISVRVASDTLIRAQAPPYTGQAEAGSHAAVAVVVSNLDSNGDVISGETATKSGAYTYERWALHPPQPDTPLTKVTVEFLARLVREVHAETGMMTHVDFGEAADGVEMPLSSLPCIGVRADYPRDIEYSQWDNGFEEVDRDDGDIDLYRGMRTYMMVARLNLAGEGMREAQALVGAVADAFIINPYVTITADETLYPGETDRYPVDIVEYPKQAKNPNKSNAMAYSMILQVRGIRTMPNVAVERIKRWLTGYLVETNMEGENVVERQLV
jgi:hypothetical protein